MRSMLVATVKNEGPWLWEWVAHHRLCGFDDIVIYQNDSDDFTVQILRALERIGAIQYFDNAFKPGAVNPPYQNRAYRRASQLACFEAADYCMALDGDEFLNVKVGAGTVADFVAAAGPADEYCILWRIFGHAGQKRLTAALATERFTRASGLDAEGQAPFTPFKSLFRTTSFKRPGIHRARDERVPRIVRRNGSGLLEDEGYARAGFRATDPGGLKLAQINHYQVRDVESFLMKSARGSASNTDRNVALRYFRIYDRNDVEETSLARKVDALRAEMTALDAATGGRLSLLRRKSLRHWRRKIADLRGQEGPAMLYAEITKAGDGETADHG